MTVIQIQTNVLVVTAIDGATSGPPNSSSQWIKSVPFNVKFPGEQVAFCTIPMKGSTCYVNVDKYHELNLSLKA